MTSLVAIIGRPNVGKSTLFNRIAGKRMALVEGVPGVTRDRLYADVEWGGHAFTVIDTGGLVESGIDRLLEQVNAQTQVAIEESKAVLSGLDARAGLNPTDQDVAAKLRRTGKDGISV